MNDMTNKPQVSAQDPITADPHADKYNDPRATVTRRGIWMGVAVLLLGIFGSAVSIYARRTGLVETTRFWGQETITALQLAERMEMLPRGDTEFPVVELTATPGLGHLRHALLEESHFDWTTETKASVAELCVRSPQATSQDPDSEIEAAPMQYIQLRLTDPTAHRVGTIEIDIDLDGGWVGPSDGSRRVRVVEWVRPKLKSYFSTIINVRQKTYDFRDE